MTVNHWVAGSSPARGANVDGSSIGRAFGCGPKGWGFDSLPSTQRGIVQLGRTLALGARGRTFKSCFPYQHYNEILI